MQSVDHNMTKTIQKSNTQQLAYKIILNNFATQTLPNTCTDELIFLLK